MRRFIVDEPDRFGPWVYARAGGGYCPTSCYAMGVDDDGVILAGVAFDMHYGKSMAMHVASAGARYWAKKQYIEAVFSYAYDFIGVEKLIGFVREDNTAARKFDEHLGFTIETRIKDACSGGDLLVYTMTRGQCKYLGARNDTRI